MVHEDLVLLVVAVQPVNTLMKGRKHQDRWCLRREGCYLPQSSRARDMEVRGCVKFRSVWLVRLVSRCKHPRCPPSDIQSRNTWARDRGLRSVWPDTCRGALPGVRYLMLLGADLFLRLQRSQSVASLRLYLSSVRLVSAEGASPKPASSWLPLASPRPQVRSGPASKLSVAHLQTFSTAINSSCPPSFHQYGNPPLLLPPVPPGRQQPQQHGVAYHEYAHGSQALCVH